MTKKEFEEYEKACDLVCSKCTYCKNHNEEEDDADVCFTCPVRMKYEDEYSKQKQRR